MSICPGMMVQVPDEYFSSLHRTCLGLRPSIDVQVHDDSSPGLVYPHEHMIVLSTLETLAARYKGKLYVTDVCVMTSSGTVGWIYDYNLEEVQ